MSDNFLSFISKVDAKPTDSSALANASPSEKVSQGAEFTSILEKEQAKTQDAKRADDMAGQDAEPVVKLTDVDEISQLPISPDAPVTLPIGAASGNPLPELSIHSAALKVGRVILTTANPKVSEASLSQFARSQGADVPGLMTVATDETTTPVPQTPNTQNILHGLMGGLASSSGQSPTTPVGMGPDVLAAKPSLNPKAALDNRLPFVQRTEISPADLASSRSVLPAVGLPLNTSVNASPTPQSIADLSSAAAKGADRQSITSDAQFDPSANAGFSLKKSLSEGQMEVKSASIAAHMAPVDIDLEKPALSLAGGAQEGLSQQSHSQSFTAQASAPMNAQGGLIQTPAANVPVSLADALMSSDPAQMQSRLQPYQAWTQRFGEVLAQKLALAVKDGNWTVKLNLNPASLGPVGVELQVKDGGIEGQIAATDPNVRQLLGDSMPKLRQSLEALVGEQGGVNIELGDGSDRGNKRGNNEEVELSIDLLADEFVPSQQDMASGNILRDGLNVFV
jgi:flagellar hook-length control protein FliK